MKKRIIIDARFTLENELIALRKISNEVWIVRFLRSINKSNLLNKTYILVPLNYVNKVKKILHNNLKYRNIKIISNYQKKDLDIIIKIENLYLNHSLISKLKQSKPNLNNIIIYKISSISDIKKVEDFIIRDNELIISRYINMPIARRIALFLKNYTNITPNQVTVFTFFIGMIGALLICKGSYYTDLIAIIFLQLALTFDLSDGYLARIKNQTSNFGAWFDTILDEISTYFIIFAFLIGNYVQYGFSIFSIFGIIWLISVHVITMNLWYLRANSDNNIGTNTILNDKEKSKIRIFIGRCINIWQSLDGKFYVYSLGLLLNCKEGVLLLMGIEKFITLIIIFRQQYKLFKNEKKSS